MKKLNNLGKGMVIVISGPSGVGKGTLIERLLKEDNNCVFSISATTRKPRPGEEHGVNYYYIKKEEFEENIRNGKMLEYTLYNGNYYGTLLTATEAVTEQGKDLVLDIEVEGAGNVKRKIPEALTIFIMPPAEEELLRRLKKRGSETEEEIAARLATAKREMALAKNYDYIVVNDDCDRAVNELKEIIMAEREKRRK